MSTAHERRLRRRVAALEGQVLDVIERRSVRSGQRRRNGMLSSLLGGTQRKRPMKQYWGIAYYYGHDKPGSQIQSGRDDVHTEDGIEAHNKKEAKEQLRAYVESQGKNPDDYTLEVEEA